MPASVEERTKVAERRAKVSRLYRCGKPQYELAEEFGVSQPTISLDLKAIRAEWLEQAKADTEIRYAEELAKIDNIERTCWEHFEKSCKDSVTVKLTTGESREKQQQGMGRGGKAQAPTSEPKLVVIGRQTEKSVKSGGAGDPRFLDRIAWCIETRLKLLGYLKPSDNKTTLNVVNINWDSLQERPTITPGDLLEEKIAAVAMKNVPQEQLVQVEDNKPIPYELKEAPEQLTSNEVPTLRSANGEPNGQGSAEDEGTGPS